MTDLLEEAATASDALTALVGVTDEGHKGEREELRRIADGLGGMAELVPLLAAASSAATAPLVEKLQGFKGADGVDGKDGEPGRDGADGGPGPVGPTGANGSDGRDGLDGKDGLDGAAGRNGTDGSPGGKGDKGLNWRGAFDGRISYQPDDAIEFGGSSFVAVAPIRGVAPPGNGWDLLARRGAQGPSGSGGGGGVALSNAIPLVESGSGAAGTGTKASKDDHVHPADGGGGGGSDDQTAAEVSFTPAGGIIATNVQTAIQELDTEKAAVASAVMDGDGAGGVLSGSYPNPGFAVDMATQGELDTHAGAADPHPGYTTAAELATAISGKADTASAVMDGDAAGGDLSGTYPNPSVVNDSHSHGAGTAPGAGGNIEQTLIAGDDAGGQEVTNLGQVTVNPGATQLYGLLIQALAGFDNVYNAFIRVYDEFGTEIFNIDAGGFDQKAPAGYINAHIHVSNTDNTNHADLSTQYGLELRDDVNTAYLHAGGYYGVELNAFVPINPPGQSYGQIYYDDATGAPGFLWRGKDLVGTDFSGPLGGLPGSPQTYTESNVTTDRAFNANSTTVDEIADVLGTLIADLRARGVVA